MKIAFYIFTVFMLLACSSPGPVKIFLLPIDQGPEVMRPCSRQVPGGVTAFWTPTVNEVRAMQKALASYAKDKWPEIDVKKYVVQAIGIVRDGKREVLGNYLHSEYFEPHFRLDPEPDLNKKFIDVCDGGNMFFGVDFNPTEDRIINMWVNGAL